MTRTIHFELCVPFSRERRTKIALGATASQATNARSIHLRSTQEWGDDAAEADERVDRDHAVSHVDRLTFKWRNFENNLDDLAVRCVGHGALQPRRVDHVGERWLLGRGLTQRSVFQPTRVKVRTGDERLRGGASEFAELHCLDVGFHAGNHRRRRAEFASSQFTEHLLRTRIQLEGSR